MASTTSSLSRTKTVWTTETRQFLDAAVKLTDNNWQAVAQLWTKRFEATEPHIDEHRQKGKLKAQYHEKNSKHYWASICQSKQWYTDSGNVIGAEVNAIAVELGMRLPQTMVQPASTSKKRVGSPASRTEESVPSKRRAIIISRKSKVPKSSETKRQEIQLARSDKSPFETVTPEQAHSGLPTLVFRFWDVESTHAINKPESEGFVAPYFSINGVIPPPPASTDPMLFVYIEVRGSTWCSMTLTNVIESIIQVERRYLRC